MSESKQNSSVRQLLVEADNVGQRIDNFLLGLLKGVPKTHIYRILRKGEVRVNKGRIRANYRLKAGDLIRIPPVRVAEREQKPRPGSKILQRLERAILYEDKRLLVLNKPSGVAVHGGSGLNYGVIEALRLLRPDERQLELAHRLDRDTSGCLVVAKRRSALRTLHELLRRNGVDKRYVALVSGRWEKERAKVEAPLLKNRLQGGERVVKVDPDGKPALTHFRVRERFREATLVEARLVTGRTHQLRVHLAHLGTPILGDEKYGDGEANRLMRELGLKRLFLHAESISIRWPDEGGELRIEAPLEESLKQLLDKLRE
jgi:23S rRNA pseudouridine955/2504/2580 synthase